MVQRTQIEGGLWGLLVGDALGVPYEFSDPSRIPAGEPMSMEPPAGFARAHRGTPPGTWSDDGAQALCLLDSLLERGRLDVDDLGERMSRWYFDGYLAVDQRVFDVGVTTSYGLRQLSAGVPASQSGRTDDQSNGNGSLMRVLPLALWHRGSDEELVDDAHAQGLVTHGHPRSQVCCALYCLWARRLAAGRSDAWGEAVAELRAIYRTRPEFERELEWSVRPDDLSPGTGSGYVVDSLRSARWALEQGSYEEAVRASIRLGHDTDTTACIAGGAAGVRDGVEAIPARWLSALRGRELVTPLLDALLAR